MKDGAIFIEEVTPVRADRAAVVQIHLARLKNFNFSRWSKSFTFFILGGKIRPLTDTDQHLGS